MMTTDHRARIGFAVTAAALLAWASPATAEDCGSPCTVTRAGLPTFRLVNTVDQVNDWDLETSAFGVELARASDDPNTGAFRVGHFSQSNTLVIGEHRRVGINTSVPAPFVDLTIGSVSPGIRLDDTSSGAGLVVLNFDTNTFRISGQDSDADLLRAIVLIDNRAPVSSFSITDSGRVGIGSTSPSAKLHVAGDARVDGNVALGSSRTLKSDFDAVDPAEVLAKLADLPIASWRYKSEDEATRHIGPFAEDFQRLFGLGDGETISMVDAQGVALAAIQGVDGRLDREVADLRAGIASLTDTNLRLASENADLRNRLETIEEVLGHLGAALSRNRQEPSE